LQRRPTGIIRLELLSSPSSSSFDLVLKVLFIIPARSFSSLSNSSILQRKDGHALQREKREEREERFLFRFNSLCREDPERARNFKSIY